MKTETQYTEAQKRITYEYFIQRKLQDDLEDGWKDAFLSDRVKYDDLQRMLNADGHNMVHDEIKNIVRYMDKGGYLGGIAVLETYDARHESVLIRKRNLAEYGNPNGIDGIKSDIQSWAEKANSPLDEYYQTPGWQARSIAFRKSRNWTCELCLKDHTNSKHKLHTHHRTYKLADGTCCLHRETDRELMALCEEPCHKMADIARMVREGKHKWQIEETMSLF
jgi:hypothetical protein